MKSSKPFQMHRSPSKPHESRQNIVDSWPADICDEAACRDWGWKPDYDIETCI